MRVRLVAAGDFTANGTLLRPIFLGRARRIYSFMRKDGRDDAYEFLESLKKTDPAHLGAYLAGFQIVGDTGRAPKKKWHMLDPDRVPKGTAKYADGTYYSLKSMGEFKHVAGQSRIFHCTDPDQAGVFVLLTVFTEKKEDELTAEALNPALYARDQYLLRKQALLADLRRTQ